MAARKKAATANRRTTAAKHLIDIPSLSGRRGGMNFSSILAMPAVRYAAGGLALYGLVRLAMKVADSYPQIGEFFSENLEGAEEKFRTWTSREGSAEIADSTH